MTVNKNLFVYDLAVVAIMKNEAPYIAEWLDYHLLAGVNHFYIYDNESPDNLKEVLRPYIEKGIVTYIFYPGKARQYEAYSEAVRNFKFFCRYMAFIDGDEFILPRTGSGIVEVADEVFSKNPAAGLCINWQIFGSNGLEKADYSAGVLERFNRRAKRNWVVPVKDGRPGGNAHVKTLANPRRIRFFPNPHFPAYCESCRAIDAQGNFVDLFFNDPPAVEKIVINHYYVKSKEEWENKVRRGNADFFHNNYFSIKFDFFDRNDEFDDEILKYRENRQSLKISPESSEEIILRLTGTLFEIFSGREMPPNFFEDKKLQSKLLKEISANLERRPRDFFEGNVETFLICLKLSSYLKENFPDKKIGKIFEEISLKALLVSLHLNISFVDARLVLDELPEILKLKSPLTKNFVEVCIKILSLVKDTFRQSGDDWRGFSEADYLQRLLSLF